MAKFIRSLQIGFLVACLMWTNSGWSWGLNVQPAELKDVGVTEHLGNTVSIRELHFTDEEGKQVSLSNYFKPGKPVVLAMVYYQCPNLCSLLLGGIVESFRKFDWTVGKEFEFVAVSIDPREGPKDAREKKEKYLGVYDRPESVSGWHFLTATEDQSKALAEQVGFKYHYDQATKQYAHTAVSFVLTPEGKISRYLYGISFIPKDFRFSLVEASGGKVGTVTDRILLSCFHFDPARNSYTLRMWRVVQLVMCIQVLALGGILWLLWRKEKFRKTVSLSDGN
jgi:protein SCO1/2